MPLTQDCRLTHIWVPPSERAVGVHQRGWVSMARYRTAAFILLVGSMGAQSIVRMRIMQADDEYGSRAKPIEGKEVVLQQLAGDGDDAVVIEIKGTDLVSGYAYVSAEIEIENAPSHIALLPFLSDASAKPIPLVNWTEVLR